MIFDIFSRKGIEEYNARNNHIVISLRDPGSEKAKLSNKCKEFRLAELFIECSDVDSTDYGKPFTEEMAKEVWRIVDTYENDISLIVINCEVGVSRSAGVGAAISKVINGDDKDFFRYFCPNMFIYNKVRTIKQ